MLFSWCGRLVVKSISVMLFVNVYTFLELSQAFYQKQNYRDNREMTTTMEWEKPLEAAKRELLEETGNASTTNNFTHSFIARGVKKISSQHLDRTEDIEPILMNVEQVKELLVSDKIKQSLMAAPMWKFFATEGLL